jgi:hypothetical protein
MVSMKTKASVLPTTKEILALRDNPKFQPRKIEFLGNPVSFKKDTELERAVILALNNRCQTSPFLESSVGYDFFIVDDEKDARTKD